MGGPFTSDLSGQYFFTLVKAGHFPRALVFGTCVYHVAHQSVRQAMKMTGRNMEIPLFTEAVYTARELAMTRMERRSGPPRRRRDRRRPGWRVQPHLGRARHRVPRHRHRRDHLTRERTA